MATSASSTPSLWTTLRYGWLLVWNILSTIGVPAGIGLGITYLVIHTKGTSFDGRDLVAVIVILVVVPFNIWVHRKFLQAKFAYRLAQGRMS